MRNFSWYQKYLNNMANISEFSLTELASGIKKKDFTSEEATKSFINNSKKTKKLNAYITECFDDAIKSAKDFDKKKDYKGLLPGIPIAVKDLFCTKNIKLLQVVRYYTILSRHTNLPLQIIYGLKVLFY